MGAGSTGRRRWGVPCVVWSAAVAAAALAPVMARGVTVYRCYDGWTNLGQERWSIAIFVLVPGAVALGLDLALLGRRRGPRRLVVAATIATVAVVALGLWAGWAALPTPPASGTCGD